MKAGDHGRAMDSLLRAAFSDDLPGQAKARLRATMAEFLEDRRAEGRSLPWWQAALGRPTLALASALMVMAGLLLSTVEGRTASADPYDRLSAVVSTSMAVSRATSMACQVSVGPPGAARVGVLRWDHTRGARLDPALPPELLTLLVPEVLARRMYREWIPLRAEDRPEAGAVALFLRSADGRLAYEVQVDRRTRKPRLLRRMPLSAPAPGHAATDLAARCAWDGALE